jgi:flagellar motor protein MotB
MMIALIVAALIVPLASLQPFAHTAAPSLTQKKTLQIQEARQAMERAEAEAQQCVEDQRQEIELHLRTIEREQRERTGEQRCEIEQQLRELSARKESALAEELQAQQEAALRLEEAQRGAVTRFRSATARVGIGFAVPATRVIPKRITKKTG